MKKDTFKRLLALPVIFSSLIYLPFHTYSEKVMGNGRENIYKCGNTEEKKVALTFDDGPHPEYTPEIISILEEYSVTGTFFVIGKSAAAYPEIIKKEAENGYEIGNHTETHLQIRGANYKAILDEVENAEMGIEKITQKKVRFFRPPGGVVGDSVAKVAVKKNYSVILWTIDTRDWAHPSEDEIVECVKNNLSPGAIILFHDYVFGKSNTPAALRQIIPYILSEGYEIVSLEELLGM